MKYLVSLILLLVLFIAGTTTLLSQSTVSHAASPHRSKTGRPLMAREIFENMAGLPASDRTSAVRHKVSGVAKGAAIGKPKTTLQAGVILQEQWAAWYNGPNDGGVDNGEDVLGNGTEQMAVDHNGNVYVTGYSFDATNYDFATVKYDSNGNQKWVKRYNSGDGGDAYSYAIAVDANGNVYVTGPDQGSGGNDVNVTIKYDSAGNQLWTSRFDTAGFDNVASGMSLDASGNVYVAGYSVVAGGNPDFFTVKYNSSGSQQWAQLYNSDGGGPAYAYALAVDGNRSVYVTGSVWSVDANYGAVTIKYDSSGNQLWVGNYNGLGLNNACYALGVDAYGNVYAGGYAATDGSDEDYATIKYNASGHQQWARMYHSNSSGGNNIIQALAVDGSSNVYVTGAGWGGSDTGYQYSTIKYDSSGNQKWSATYNNYEDATDRAQALALDNAGNVYVTGYSANMASAYGYATVKYDTAGNQVWVARFDTSAGGAGGHDIKVDNAGNVYVAGTSANGTNDDYVTFKYKQVPVLIVDTITASAGGNGSISPSGKVAVDQGANQIFICTADTGYHIDSIFVDSVYVGNTSPDTIKDVTAAGTISVKFAIDTLTITATAGVHGGVFPSGVTRVLYGGSQTFYITPTPEYLVDSIFVDGVGFAGTTNYTFTDVTAPHTLSATFTLAPPYLVSYRTFTSNAIATSTFGKKSAVPVKKKADKYEFSISLSSPHGGYNTLELLFSNPVDTSYAFTVSIPATSYPNNDPKLKNWVIDFTNLMTRNETVVVDGFCLKKQKILNYRWVNIDSGGAGNLIKNPPITLHPRLPMPNAVNAVQQAFADNAFPGGLLIGKNHATDGLKKKYGWVLAGKYTDVMSSLYTKGLTQDAASHAFDENEKGKALAGKYKSLSPKTYNSRVFGDLLALKINLSASAKKITPPGLGLLHYIDTVANEFNGLSLDSLAAIGDSLRRARIPARPTTLITQTFSNSILSSRISIAYSMAPSIQWRSAIRCGLPGCDSLYRPHFSTRRLSSRQSAKVWRFSR